MTENEEQRIKIAKWLYDRATNTSSKKLTRPKDNENIILPPDISTINTGKDFLKKNMFIRLRFVGSDKFYEMFFKDKSSYNYWTQKIEQLEFDIDTMDESEEIPAW